METLYNLYKTKERIDIIYTLKCTIQCEHCMLSCSPMRNEKIGLSFAKDILKTVKRFGCKSVLFSGGEVFIFKDELFELAQLCSSLGMAIEIETNGFFGKELNIIRAYLDPIFSLSNNKVLYISLDYYHLKYIKLENILNIAQYCKEHHVPCEVNIAPYTLEFDNKLKQILNKRKILWISEPLINVGQAKYLKNIPRIAIPSFKQSDDYAFTIMPDGKCYTRCDLATESISYSSTYGYLGQSSNIKEFKKIYISFLKNYAYE